VGGKTRKQVQARASAAAYIPHARLGSMTAQQQPGAVSGVVAVGWQVRPRTATHAPCKDGRGGWAMAADWSVAGRRRPPAGRHTIAAAPVRLHHNGKSPCRKTGATAPSPRSQRSTAILRYLSLSLRVYGSGDRGYNCGPASWTPKGEVDRGGGEHQQPSSSR